MKAGKIYGLKCPVKNKIVYIGKTVSKLSLCLYRHKNSSVESVRTWIKSLGDLVSRVEIIVLEDDIDVALLHERENYWISVMGDGLLNTRPSVAISKEPKNEGLRKKMIHLTEDTVVKLTVKASKQKPRITAKEYIQNLCIKAVK